jgi:hypothetical protein
MHLRASQRQGTCQSPDPVLDGFVLASIINSPNALFRSNAFLHRTHPNAHDELMDHPRNGHRMHLLLSVQQVYLWSMNLLNF